MQSKVVHFEIPANDVQRALKFYRGLFDWEINETPGFDDYYMVKQESEHDTGIAILPRQNPQHPAVNYIQVASVDESLQKAEALGGTVAMPKMPVPGVGHIAFIKDPEDNIFGILETERPM